MLVPGAKHKEKGGMNLIDWFNAEMQASQKLQEFQSYIQDLTDASSFDGKRTSGRKQFADFLVNLGLTLDPEVVQRLNGLTPASRT